MYICNTNKGITPQNKLKKKIMEQETYAIELQNFLRKALQDSFSANAALRVIEEKIEEKAEEITFNKYKDHTPSANGLRFKLGGVKASLRHYNDDLTFSKIELTLTWFCDSKLPKAKRERLQKAKDEYKERKCITWNSCKYKVPIWHQYRYKIDIQEALSDNISLNIYD